MASSIALVGMQHRDFRPLSLPIPDDHPCLDRDGYGFSKHLMEQVTHYYARQNPDIDVLNLRLTSVAPDDAQPRGMRPLGQWALGGITVTLVSDIVKLLVAAVDGPHAAGARTFNAGSSRAWATVPTAELLENWWGDAVDRSYYLKPGHEYDSPYDMSAVEQEFGWKAENTLKRLEEQ